MATWFVWCRYDTRSNPHIGPGRAMDAPFVPRIGAKQITDQPLSRKHPSLCPKQMRLLLPESEEVQSGPVTTGGAEFRAALPTPGLTRFFPIEPKQKNRFRFGTIFCF